MFRFMEEFMKVLEITRQLSTAYHLQIMDKWNESIKK